MEQLLKILIEYGVLGVLALLSFISVYIGIERWLYYKDVQPRQFASKTELEVLITARLTLLSTIAANAVYVGLLGTILGIMLTFSSLGSTGIIDAKIIMQSLSFTLIATAAGLLVAIPAIVIYNFLVRKAEVLLAEWDVANGA